MEERWNETIEAIKKQKIMVFGGSKDDFLDVFTHAVQAFEKNLATPPIIFPRGNYNPFENWFQWQSEMMQNPHPTTGYEVAFNSYMGIERPKKVEKPINLESIGKDFYEPINKERKCPICKNPLFYDMFIARNTHEIKDIQSYLNEKESLTELWEDKRVAIPCCSCFTRLESESK